MVKAILMIKNEIILPTAGFESMNPKIQGKDKLMIPTEPIPWPSNEPKRVMVTNFGTYGTWPLSIHFAAKLVSQCTDLKGRLRWQ